MFDIGFSELLLFGVIALIVLGPEKLPQAARTAGQWYAKLRRTVTTLQSEIEAELDLAETRKQMQDELAKIRQTEADMQREIAAMRGNMQAYEQAQNATMKGGDTPSEPAHSAGTDETHQSDASPTAPHTPDYAYGQAAQQAGSRDEQTPVDDTSTREATVIQPILTKPWENMWFRLGDYDRARRLPPPPRVPNYQADTLLYINTPTATPQHSAPQPSSSHTSEVES